MNIVQNKEITDADKNDERELVYRVKKGDQSAFRELISRYQKKIFKLAYGFFQDRDDAMEIVQETFIRVYQKLGSFDLNSDLSQFSSWVHRIGYNLCIDYYRKFKKQKAEMKDLYELDEENRNSGTRMEENLDHENFRNNLEELVMKLPGKQKKVFILKHYDGLKHQEIAILLNLSVGTIKTLYHRSIKNLKKNMGVTNGVTP